MAEPATPTFSSILEYLHLTLRYIASGFVAVGVYVFLYHPAMADFKDQSWFLTFITATIGIITYGLHFATLDKIFYGWSIIRFLKNNNRFLPDILKDQIVDWQNAKKKNSFKKEDILSELKDDNSNKTRKRLSLKKWIIKTRNNIHAETKIKRYILFALANQTYLRSISKNELLAGIQNQVERRLALLNFLYCSFYQIVVITLYFGLSKILLHKEILNADVIKIVILLSFAGAMFFSAVRFNWRICSREMWLVQNFPQKVEEVKLADKKEAPKATFELSIKDAPVNYK